MRTVMDEDVTAKPRLPNCIMEAVGIANKGNPIGNRRYICIAYKVNISELVVYKVNAGGGNIAIGYAAGDHIAG